MVKYSHPFNEYYERMEKGFCPLCNGEDIDTFQIVWCSFYGTYLTEEACEVYGGDGDGHCKHCSFDKIYSSRQDVDDQVMLCNSCKKAINFDKQEVTKFGFDFLIC